MELYAALKAPLFHGTEGRFPLLERQKERAFYKHESPVQRCLDFAQELEAVVCAKPFSHKKTRN